MKLFSGFLLVLAFLAVSACTDEETTEVVKIYCSTTGELLEEGEKCPPPEDTSNNNTPGNQGGSTGDQMDTSDTGEPGRSDCTPVQGVDLMATSQDDIICGNERGNTIYGLAGDDTIYGGPGNDILIGGDDRDTLKGEAGNDTLRGGEDNDILDGGAGTDTADYSKENQPQPTADDLNPDPVTTVSVVVNLAEGQATDTEGDDDTLISIENVIGTPGVDTIIGDSGPNEIDGFGAPLGATDTLLDGGAGSDTIVVSANFDLAMRQAGDNASIRNFENIKGKRTTTNLATTLVLTGDDNPNTITGTALTDTLNGAGGNDRLIGGAGEDCFIIEIPSSFAEVEADVPPATSSSDPKNAGRKTVIRGTKDTISDYEAVDKIAINAAGGATPPDPVDGTDEESVKAAEVKSVIIYKGRIDVVTAYRASEGQDTTDDETDDVRGISQQTETLVTVPGLPAGSDKVSIGATCP